jgi:DNA (cytosine-5)-methyltransferase 1
VFVGQGKYNTVIKVGTLFSGIGAFEHALKQLNIQHKILFACDNGERELPLTYGDLFKLTAGLNDEQLYSFCEEYISKIGVKKDLRKLETDLLFQLAHKTETPPQTNVVVEYNKVGRKSPVKHKLAITQEQIIALTPNMTMKQREQYVKALYDNMPEHNYVKDAYFANYDVTDAEWHEDIRFLDAKEYEGNLDILIGGSPCQSFSNYGKKLGLEDVRGTLFYDYARVINEAKPKVFIYENVENVTKNDGGKTWKAMFSVWQSLGYHIEWDILDAKDYNHPQLRSRLFLIGFREDIYTKPYTFPEKMELKHKSTEYLEKGEVSDIYYLGKKGFEWITTPEKNLRRSRVNQDVIGCETAYQQDNWIGDFRVEKPKPHHYNDERIYVGKFDFKDGKGLVDAVGRKMTPRECMNLMGFDDSFKIVVNDSIAYRHAGNSIVVPVLKEIIKTLIPYL